MKKILVFFAGLLLSASVSAATPSIVDKLNAEEAKWHKGFVFSTAASAESPEDRIAVLDWLKSRAQTPDMPDARYALFYSYMLRNTRNPAAIETSALFAIIGYFALQIDSARCANRNESIQIARQWYETARPQLMALKIFPAEVRQRYLMMAQGYLLTYRARTDPALVQSSSWMCYHLPGYLNKIRNLPDAVTETTQDSHGKLTVFISHPSVQPELADAALFNSRVDTIMKDMETIVMKGS